MINFLDLGFAIEPDEERNICEIGNRNKRSAIVHLLVKNPINSSILGITNFELMGLIKEENG